MPASGSASPTLASAGLVAVPRQASGIAAGAVNTARQPGLALLGSVDPGRLNYYGRFYRSELVSLLRRINTYLVRWAKRKYKQLRRHTTRAKRWLVRVARRQPTLFAHWRMVRPDGWTMGAE